MKTVKKGAPAITAGAYRRTVAARIAAAVGGGYALATLSAMVIAQSVPLPDREANQLGAMIAFLVLTAAVIWVFAASSVVRAWVGVLVPAGLLFLALLGPWAGSAA